MSTRGASTRPPGARCMTRCAATPKPRSAVDETVRRVAKDGWRGNRIKTAELKQALRAVMPTDRLDELLDVIRAQDEYAP